MSALSSMFSICTDSVYVPEWPRSAERMKRMESTSLVRVPTDRSSSGTPSLSQVTSGRGLPWEPEQSNNRYAWKVPEDGAAPGAFAATAGGRIVNVLIDGRQEVTRLTT